MSSPSLKASPPSPSLAPPLKLPKRTKNSSEGPREEGVTSHAKAHATETSEEAASAPRVQEVLMDVELDNAYKGKIPELAYVPESPVKKNPNALLQEVASIQPEEAYSKDEEALNTFLKLHPMLR